MQVTFLMGNGFDLNAGLKTRFSDFFKVYCKNKDQDSDTIKRFKNEIGNNVEKWSDFERQMGKYTANVWPDGVLTHEEYFTCMEDFRNNLVQYLERQERDVFVSARSYEVMQKCREMLQDPFKCLRDGQRTRLQRYVKQQPHPLNVEYDFIVFNYTSICDSYMSGIQIKGVDNYCSVPNLKAGISVNRFVHVHGKLGEEILLGVDNDLQIENKELRKDEKFAFYYIKPTINSKLQTGYDEAAKQLIESSNIIIIYGMSIGETDKTWWKLIADRLLAGEKGQECFLVVYLNDGTLHRSSAGDAIKSQIEIRNKFLKVLESKSDIDEKDREYVSEHIFCALNTDILTPDKL